jgi:hypothetical protein
MRNPRHARCGYYGIASDQILAVFDPSDKALGITELEREELAMAYLANPAVVAFSQEHMCHAYDEYGPNDCSARRERLWQLLAHFPCARVKERGFRYLGGEDKWKAEVYRNTEEPWLRMELLLGARETDVELLRLGAADKEECCWEVAHQKYIDPKCMKAGKPGMPESAWWTYTVATISSVVPLFIAWLAFGLARTPFERLLLAMLALLYLRMEAGGLGREWVWSLTSQRMDREFRRIRKLTGEKLSEDEQEEQRWEDAATIVRRRQESIVRRILMSLHMLTSAYVVYQLYLVLRHGWLP